MDIIENSDRILEYTRGLNLESYLATPLVQDATERCLSRISEAAVKLGAHAEMLLPGHPWKQIRTLGNVLRHVYDVVDKDMIWTIATDRLPSLVDDARAVVVGMPPDPNT